MPKIKKKNVEIEITGKVNGKKVTKVIKSYGPMVEAVDLTGRAARRKISTRDLRRIYEQDDLVGPIIDAIVFSCTTAGYHFEAYPNEEINQRHLEIVLRFFEEVNEEDTLNDLLHDCFLDLNVYGNEYWEKKTISKDMVDYEENLMDNKMKPEDIKVPYRLYRLNPEFVEVEADEHGKIIKFVQKIHGRENVDFVPEKIIDFKITGPGSSLYGTAPGAKVGVNSAIAANMYCSDYNGKFFQNNATPRLHIDLGNVTKEDLKEFKEKMETELKGNPHKNLITRSRNKDNRVQVNPISLKNEEMEFSTYARALRQRIFGAYRMQPIIMGITEQEGKTTVDAQISIYKALCIKPLQRIVADRINRKIMKKMFPGIKLKFAFNPVDILDQLDQVKISEMELKNQIKTVNEIRRERGYTSVPWGKTPIIPFMGEAGQAQMPGGEEEKDEQEK